MIARERRAWDEWKDERVASTYGADARREARRTLESIIFAVVASWRARLGVYELCADEPNGGTSGSSSAWRRNKERGGCYGGQEKEVKTDAVQPGGLNQRWCFVRNRQSRESQRGLRLCPLSHLCACLAQYHIPSDHHFRSPRRPPRSPSPVLVLWTAYNALHNFYQRKVPRKMNAHSGCMTGLRCLRRKKSAQPWKPGLSARSDSRTRPPVAFRQRAPSSCLGPNTIPVRLRRTAHKQLYVAAS